MKQNIPSSFGLYVILTDPLRGYDYCTKLCVDSEIAFVQLRMKNAHPDAVLPVAELMRRITQGTHTRLIINDFPDVAARVTADGVHIGQTDASYAATRAIVGDRAIIGLSTHSPDQVRVACALSPGYIGVGPVYATPTKKIPDPPLGLDIMRDMLNIATVPAVAIGGITLETLPDVLAHGAHNFCMVRPLNQTTEPEKILLRILNAWKSYKGIS